MSQIALYCFNVISGADGSDSVTVAQVMKTNVRAADRSGDAFKILVYGMYGQMMADHIGKYKS